VFAHAFDWFAAVLHCSQSLISQTKDPQFNYVLAQTFLAERGPLKTTLLVDLAKAFERVDTKWLLFLLQPHAKLFRDPAKVLQVLPQGQQVSVVTTAIELV
jgi:hypothetical protein